MIEFQIAIVIQRPVEEVFAFLSDFENVPRWNYFVRSVEKRSDGPPGKETVYHQIRRSDQQDFVVTEYQPQKAITVRTLDGSQPWFERRFVFSPVENGTRIVDSWQLELGRGPLVQWLGASRVKSAVAENLGKLKELLETGHTQLQDGRVVTV